MTKHVHGGNIYTYRNCLDFSANCNPLGTPESVKQAIRDSLEQIKDYPQVGYQPLKEAIAAYEAVEPEHIICGNGAAELMFLLAQSLRPKHAVLAQPCFFEYEQSLQAVDCQITNVWLRAEDGFELTAEFVSQIPADADLVFDVRFLPNPYYIDELRPKSGNDREVREYVMNNDKAREFLAKLTDMIEFLIPNYVQEGKTQLVIGIGCTGGKHRSVTLANELYEALQKNDNYGIRIEHRDIGKDAITKAR